jgi:flagellar motor switch protein FliN/FliY
MNEGILSQEEIDALLNSGSNSQPAAQTNGSSASTAAQVEITDFEKDALGEIGNISMGTSATTLSTLLRRKVSITTPDVSVTTRQKLQSDYPLPYVVIEVKYTHGLSGTNILVMKEQDAAVIANLMMGGDGRSGDLSLDDITLSAVGEAMNQMMGSATTSLSSMFNQRIDIAPPMLTLVDLGKSSLNVSTDFENLVQIKFKMEIEQLVNSELMQIIPLEAVRSMIDNLMANTTEEANLDSFTEPGSPASGQMSPPQSYSPPEPQVASAPSPPSTPAVETWDHHVSNDIPSGVKKGEKFAVQPVQFASLSDSATSAMPQNIDLIMDVPLNVTVELGKTQKTIKEILELSQGSIIQLDKMAGEPVDLMVNGKLVAKGEVVVIDENYGIRITAIISPMDRMNKLQ